MSRFLSRERRGLVPYTPGEQPRGEKLIKLNTNEAPFPPPQSVVDAASAAARGVNLYSDPEGTELRAALAEYHGVSARNISLGNGSDETLAFAFAAFGGADSPFAFPDVTYGFYPVFAALFGVPFTEIPTDSALGIRPEDYIGLGKNIVLANPNAPTGEALPIDDVKRIADSNPNNVVIIDEAYADFWGETAIPLTERCENLLVVRTYSKSRFFAGARLGYAVGNAILTGDLETVRYSFNPYNLNSMTLAAGARALTEDAYYKTRWREITETREETQKALRALGFETTRSQANFIFARYVGISGAELMSALRERGLLTRALSRERVLDRLRITVGTPEQMKTLVGAAEEIIGTRKNQS
ncbi:MAG: aminotransferase class I/II-fold pyridoxal phosphate-dependent enzyme [Oscillospiraceae bacterium]|jgi:histidinol-phosphate aminotransferase|nr:aminotransferase class I/II-fold pyridoxal phosphate-dependent enzyme [Oscillospiraceae bacterium]